MRGSERFGDFFGIRKHQAATSACFSARGRGLLCLAPARRPRHVTQPGHSLACSRGFKQSGVVCECLEGDGAQNRAGKERRQEAWACYPGAPWLGASPRGAWNPGAKALRAFITVEGRKQALRLCSRREAVMAGDPAPQGRRLRAPRPRSCQPARAA